jgi:hypothetical protein
MSRLMKFDGSTSWTLFRWQFVAEHNLWTPRKKATYLIVALHEPATYFLHGIPTGVTYYVTEALDNRCSDQHLEEAFHA